jgi:hypothetical protein
MCKETPDWAVDLNATIIAVEKVFRSVVGERILLRTRLDPALSLSNVNPRKLESVLVNLFMRASDATPAGGELTVSTSNLDLDPAAAAGIGVSPGAYLLIELHVNGGMDAPAVVRDVIRQAHGAISVTNPGNQTTVSIVLPAAARQARWTS